jgi:hypothetical protein
MDAIRMHKGWCRAHKKFLEDHPVDTRGFRPPKLTPGEVEQIEQSRQRHAAKKTRLIRQDNHVGSEFDMLLVWELELPDRDPRWWCLCGCGDFCNAKSSDLIAGRKKDCGCRQSERERVSQYRQQQKAA